MNVTAESLLVLSEAPVVGPGIVVIGKCGLVAVAALTGYPQGEDVTAVTKVTARAARKDLDQLIDWASDEKERIVLTRRSKKVVALVPIEDLELLEDLEDRTDLEEARRVLARLKNGEESTDKDIPGAVVVPTLWASGSTLAFHVSGPGDEESGLPVRPGNPLSA